MGLLRRRPFKPIKHFGTVTFYRGKIRRDLEYEFYSHGPIYRGELIKESLKILGKKRVRVFLHVPKTEKNPQYAVLLLGTKEGTIGLAPLVRRFQPQYDLTFLSIIKKPSAKLYRVITFGYI